MCHHRTPRHSTKRTGGVPDGRSLVLFPRGSDSGSVAEHTAGGGGIGSDNHRGPGPRRMSLATGNKHRGLADSAAVHSEWDRAGAQEWCDALFLRYGLDPPYPPKYCDGCNAKFKICHALDCMRGSLVTARHNELRDGVAVTILAE